MGAMDAIGKAVDARTNGPSQAELQKRADKAISNFIMKPAIDRATKNINTNVQKFRDAIKGEGG
jgi:hypothetical protein